MKRCDGFLSRSQGPSEGPHLWILSLLSVEDPGVLGEGSPAQFIVKLERHAGHTPLPIV